MFSLCQEDLKLKQFHFLKSFIMLYIMNHPKKKIFLVSYLKLIFLFLQPKQLFISIFLRINFLFLSYLLLNQQYNVCSHSDKLEVLYFIIHLLYIRQMADFRDLTLLIVLENDSMIHNNILIQSLLILINSVSENFPNL